MIDPSNPPPPPGGKPGRYAYTQDSAAPIWIEDPWWRRVPWLKVLGLVVAFFAHGHIGISNLLAGIIGLRGCEMRVIPYLIEQVAGSDTELALCPGVWTPIDRWEAGLRQENR